MGKIDDLENFDAKEAIGHPRRNTTPDARLYTYVRNQSGVPEKMQSTDGDDQTLKAAGWTRLDVVTGNSNDVESFPGGPKTASPSNAPE